MPQQFHLRTLVIVLPVLVGLGSVAAAFVPRDPETRLVLAVVATLFLAPHLGGLAGYGAARSSGMTENQEHGAVALGILAGFFLSLAASLTIVVLSVIWG